MKFMSACLLLVVASNTLAGVKSVEERKQDAFIVNLLKQPNNTGAYYQKVEEASLSNLQKKKIFGLSYTPVLFNRTEVIKLEIKKIAKQNVDAIIEMCLNDFNSAIPLRDLFIYSALNQAIEAKSESGEVTLTDLHLMNEMIKNLAKVAISTNGEKDMAMETSKVLDAVISITSGRSKKAALKSLEENLIISSESDKKRLIDLFVNISNNFNRESNRDLGISTKLSNIDESWDKIKDILVNKNTLFLDEKSNHASQVKNQDEEIRYSEKNEVIQKLPFFIVRKLSTIRVFSHEKDINKNPRGLFE
jgi:hypothetical protein